MKRFCDCDNPECKQCKTDAYHNAENEKLQAQVARLLEAGGWAALHWSDAQSGFQSTELLNFREALEQNKSDWLAQHDQQVRDAANVQQAEEIERLKNSLEMSEAIVCGDGALISGLRGEIEELTRKLAEQQALCVEMKDAFCSGDDNKRRKAFGAFHLDDGSALMRLLAEERKKAVPEGWQLVPIEPNSKMLDEIHLVDDFTYAALSARYKAMLSAAPQP